MKQKKIILDEKEILLVEIEPYSNWFKFFRNNELLYESKNGNWETLKLLDGNYTFLKKAVYLDEWDWAQVIERIDYVSEDSPYVDYTGLNKWFRSPIDSGLALLKYHNFEIEKTLIVK